MARYPYFRMSGYDNHQHIAHYQCCACRDGFVELPDAKFCPHCGTAITRRPEWDTDEEKQYERQANFYLDSIRPYFTVESRIRDFSGEWRPWSDSNVWIALHYQDNPRKYVLAVVQQILKESDWYTRGLEVRILKDGRPVLLRTVSPQAHAVDNTASLPVTNQKPS